MGIRHITNTASPLFYKQLHVSVFEKSYISFLIAVSLCTCRQSNEEYSGCDSSSYAAFIGLKYSTTQQEYKRVKKNS